MLCLTALVGGMSILVSLLGKPTNFEHLKKFALRAKPPKFLWSPVLEKTGADYESPETMGRVLVSWFLAATSVITLIFAIGKLLLGEPMLGLVNLALFAVSTYLIVKRTNQDFKDELEKEAEEEAEVAASTR